MPTKSLHYIDKAAHQLNPIPAKPNCIHPRYLIPMSVSQKQLFDFPFGNIMQLWMLGVPMANQLPFFACCYLFIISERFWHFYPHRAFRFTCLVTCHFETGLQQLTVGMSTSELNSTFANDPKYMTFFQPSKVLPHLK